MRKLAIAATTGILVIAAVAWTLPAGAGADRPSSPSWNGRPPTR